jgi:hypothetical protein
MPAVTLNEAMIFDALRRGYETSPSIAAELHSTQTTVLRWVKPRSASQASHGLTAP